MQKDLKFSKNIRDTCKVENKNSICISVFDYENKGKYQIYVLKKRYEKKNMLIYYWKGEEDKGHHVLIKDFNKCMYDHTFYRGRNHI